MEEGLTEIDIEHTHRVGKPKQNKRNPRPIIIKFVRYSCRWRIFLNEIKIENTGLSITENLTAKRMEMLHKAKERFGFKNVWTLDGRIYYLTEGSTKPQIFRNWTKVACLSYGKNLWREFLFRAYIFIVIFFGGGEWTS